MNVLCFLYCVIYKLLCVCVIESSLFSGYINSEIITLCSFNFCEAGEVCWNNYRKCYYFEYCS